MLSGRSALKKILERDDVSSRTMVLCVSSVSVTGNQTESVAPQQKDQDGEKDGNSTTKKCEVTTCISNFLVYKLNLQSSFCRDFEWLQWYCVYS